MSMKKFTWLYLSVLLSFMACGINKKNPPSLERPAEQPDSISQQELARRQAQLDQEHQIQFLQFIDLFQENELPVKFTDRQVRGEPMRPTAIPIELTEKFICDIEGSSLQCVGPEPHKDLRGAYYPISVVPTDTYYLCFYQEFFLDTGEMILASYTKSGKLLSRMEFAGSNSYSETVNGILDSSFITLTTYYYDMDEIYEPDHLNGQRSRKLDINPDGYFIEEGKKIRDEL